jgi:hypothetical protein
MKPSLAIVLLLALLPAGLAQSQPIPGQAQAAIQTPHEVSLEIGENPFLFRAYAVLRCTPGLEGPAPLQVIVAAGAHGPDDGSGSAWTFTQTSWNFTWQDDGAGNYSIDEEFTVTVDAEGYGSTRGYFGEFTMSTVAVRNASSSACTSTGYTIPVRGGHAHISVGARPASTDPKDSPGLGLAGAAMGLAFLALARRRA